MASQIDMFASQQNNENKINGTPRVSSTCPPKLNFWKWVILFEKDENAKFPFLIYPVAKFGGEIKDSWLKSILSNTSRDKTITLSALENKKVSLFGKIEASKFNLSNHFSVVISAAAAAAQSSVSFVQKKSL